jgi:hypothetical protein
MDQEDRDAAPEKPPPDQAGKWIVWRARGARWWKPARALLLVAEAGCVLAGHEAPAGVARALVVTGDVIFRPREH